MLETKIKPVFRICNDTVFKEVFTKVPNALIRLVNDCLDIDYDNFKDNIKIECTSELSKGRFDNKTTVCDFIVQVGEYFKVNIEINQSNYTGLTERNLLFLSRLYSNFIPRGISYEELPRYKVVQLNINKFSNINGKLISRLVIMDEETKKIQTDSLFYYNFDIAKCYDIYYNNVESSILKNSKIVRWGALLCTDNICDIANIIGDDLMEEKDKEKFIKVVDMFSKDGGSFNEDDMAQLTEYYMAGERMLGIEEGIQQKEIETVKNMLKRNYSLEEISNITGLSEEEIIKIKE